MRKIIVPALTAVSLAVITSPVSAESKSVAVQYADLDLANPAGRATLESRIKAAAKNICGRAEVRRVRDGTDQQNCLREARASVSGEVTRLAGRQELARR